MRALALLPLACVFVFASCAPTRETSVPAESKETLYAAGHHLYLAQEYDSAAVMLKRSAALDSSYQAPLVDLAALYYESGVKLSDDRNAERLRALKQSKACLVRLESLGLHDADVYDRLCEISTALDDSRGFVLYAKKNVDHYPYDRQYFNLGVAYYGAGSFNDAIRTMKEAVEKFPASPYIGGYYRQMGMAYMKIDRDQTAERTLTSGVNAVNNRIGQMKKEDANYRSSPQFKRLMDDKVGMLVSLKRLHQIYKATDKLERVERELKEAGYEK